MMDRKLVVFAVTLLVCGVVYTTAVNFELEELEANTITDNMLVMAPAQKKAPSKKAQKKKPAQKKKGVAKESTKLPPGTFLTKQKGMDCNRVTLKKPICVKAGKKVCKEQKKCEKYGALQRVCTRKCLHHETLPATTCHTVKKQECKKWHKKKKKTFKCIKWAKHKKEHWKEKKECAKWVMKATNVQHCKKKGKKGVSCKTFDRTPVCAKWKDRSKTAKKAHKRYCARMKVVKKKICANIKKTTKKICKHIAKNAQGKKFCAVRDKNVTCHNFKKCLKHKKQKACTRVCAQKAKQLFKCKKVTEKKKTIVDKKPKPGVVPSKAEQKKRYMASKCQKLWDACRAKGSHHASCYRDPEVKKFCDYKGVDAKCEFYGFKCRWGKKDEKTKYCPKAKECGQPTVSSNVVNYIKEGLRVWTKTCKTGVATCIHNNAGKDQAWCIANKPKVAEVCKKMATFRQKMAKLKAKQAKQTKGKK